MRRRGVRPGSRPLHLPPKRLHSPAGEGARRLHPVAGIALRLLRRCHGGAPIRRPHPVVAGAGGQRDTATDCGRTAAVGEDRRVGGRSGVAAVAGRGGGETNRRVGDEGWRESVQFHAIVLRCGWVEVDCSHGYLGPVVQEVSRTGQA